ncbi:MULTISPECIES: RES family NAD+ phosphorylase [unclassified Aureimonas]|uniref:RES family NAD+ phosphorylase n=1 Tax=unclassified Aureimonas TaxID=2615206 RepID=UPI000A867ED9|nr:MULTISPECIES: RES family NAD+ phosphorylase [unclassified Aureimonas]
MTADVDDDGERMVCAECIGEAFLSAGVTRRCGEAICSFCGEMASAMTVEELADAVEAAFSVHYYRTTDQPDAFESAMLADQESDFEFERRGEDVLWAIAGAAEVSEEIAEEVLEILSERHSDFDSAAAGEECEFDPESRYEQRGPDDVEYQLEWRSFEQSLRTETRFFNKEAESLLGRIFDGVGSLTTGDGRPVVRLAGPGEELSGFHRARVFHGDARLALALEQPVRELGPPPNEIAVDGRMNARGVSLFYGATDPAAALAEVRPPVGSRALVGRFDAVRPLRLLDINALRSVYIDGSVFDSGYMGRLELAKFLKSLSGRMTMPVMPDDERSEYLITQAIADYLASNVELDLDGLLYPSVQRAGSYHNVVLFRRASKVEPVALPDGTVVSASLGEMDEDGWSPGYSVSEVVPPPNPPAPPRPEPLFWEGPFIDPFATPDDDRDPALRLEVDSLTVHEVAAVQIVTKATQVTRYRSQRRTLDI